MVERLCEEQQAECSLCCQPLVGDAIRMEACRHLLCGVCAEGGASHWPVCACCGERSKQSIEPTQQVLPCLYSNPYTSSLSQAGPTRAELLGLVAEERACTTRLMIEFGNKCVPGAKSKFTTFVKVASVDLGRGGSKLPPASKLITQVDFNINPGYPVSKDGRVRSPNNRSGFTFAYTMARCSRLFVSG